MIIQKFFTSILFFFAAVIAAIPFNFIIGSKFAWFSCASMIMPAFGYHYSLVYVIFYIFTKSLCSSKIIFLCLHKTPLLFATMTLQQRHVVLYVGLPVSAMILFVLHPIGLQAWWYAGYWFIPMLIYFFVQDSIYSRACAASFVAHAIGSIIWLYQGCISAEVWMALIPIVAIERLLIAAGMVSSIMLLQVIKNLGRQKVTV